MSIHSTFFFFFFETFLFLSSSDCAYLLEKFGRVSLFFFFFREKKKSHWNSLQPFQKQLGKDHKSFCWQVPTRLVYTLYIFFRSDRFAIRDTQNLCFFFSFCAKKKSFRFRGGWTFFFSLFYVHANELLRFLFFFKKTKNKGWNGLPQGTQDF